MKSFPRLIWMFGLTVSFPALAALAPPPQPAGQPEFCPIAKEFITTLEFIRSRNDLAITDKDAQTVALKVAEGCKDSAKRFIKITALMIHSGLVGKDAVDTGVDFAKKTNAQAEAFMAIFKRAYAEDSLDLDARSSFNLAQSLYKDFDGDVEKARADFEWLTDFCMNHKTLNLPSPQCAEFAARIARLGTPAGGGVARSFREVYEFLVSPKGPNLIAGQALKTAEEVVAKGPGAAENFIQAYRYAVSPKGLAMEVGGAIKFSLKLIPKEKEASKKN